MSSVSLLPKMMCQTDLPIGTLMQPTSGKRNDLLVSLKLGNLIVYHICYDSARARSEVKVSLR